MSAAQADGEFEPDAVRRRLPDEATPRQERALICAVRNPDASPFEIAQAAGVEHFEVVRVLSSLAHGILGTYTEGQSQTVDRRGDTRHAENYAELTDKQQAIVDFRTRHDPEFTLSGAEVARGINQVDRYDTVVDETTVPTFENHEVYGDQLDDLVAERRNILLAQGDLDDADGNAEGSAEARAAAAHRLDTRDYLELAGYTLPESNLDALDRVGDGLPETSLLDEAHENGTGVPPTDVVDTVAASEVVALDDTEADDEAVTVGTAYRGVVNGVVEWGVWVTLAGDPDDPGDVSGVVPVERLHEDDREPHDFDEGDEVIVVATGRSNTDDGKVRHRLALASVVEDSERDETLEDYWQQIDLVRYLRDRMTREGVGKAEAASSVQDAEDEIADLAEAVADLRAWVEAIGLGEDVGDEPPATLPEVEDRLDALEQAFENSISREVVENMTDLRDRLDEGEVTDEGARRRLSELAERVDAVENRAVDDVRAEFAVEALQEYAARDGWSIRDVSFDGEGRHGTAAELCVRFTEKQ